MKGPLHSSWLPKTLRAKPDNDHQSQHLVPTPPLSTSAYTDPRSAPKPPGQRSPNAFLTTTAFSREPPRVTSAGSLRSAYSASSSQSTPSYEKPSVHPYGHLSPPSPMPLNHHDDDDEQECPVCLEPLSFSFRLPGEKPHIVPECGHSLHEACFAAVYGPAPGTRGGVPRNRNLGVCGVCRRPMKIGEGDSGSKSNKLAALTGMGEGSTGRQLYPGRDGPGHGRRTPIPRPYDPNEDDALEHNGSLKGSLGDNPYIVAPSITVRPEFSSLTRSSDSTQPLTCIVVVELPSRRNPSSSPRPLPPEQYGQRSTQVRMEAVANRSAMSSPNPSEQLSVRQQNMHDTEATGRRHGQGTHMQSPTPMQERSYSRENPPDWSSTASIIEDDEHNPFAGITEDLRSRIIDWKGHPLSGLGPLQMYDLLSVRRDTTVREFSVYLFKEAIICVMEERKRGIGRLLAHGGSTGAHPDGIPGGTASRGVLRLKGRIYIKHIRRVTDTSTTGEMSLTIDMEDERLDSFILIFRDRSSLETWRAHIQRLVGLFQQESPEHIARAQERERQEAARLLDLDEFGGSAKAARMLSGSTGTTASTMPDSLLGGSARSIATSSATSHHSHGPGAAARGMSTQPHHAKMATLGEDEELTQYDPATGFVTPHLSSGPSNSLTPISHPPLDLILVISIPPPNAPPSMAALKVRVVKNTLDFVLAQLGMRDRLSLVTFEMGPGGKVRKTPFLSPSKTQSRARLAKFVDEIGMRMDESSGWKDEFVVRSQDEKTDVVTAINHGLDVVLQRKSKNPVSGMILVSDAADTTRRAQMDLVLARAEAANMPIHSFGYGRSHDPASLWLVSNNTGGTYTFVKDWYDLQSCVAGCVGGMMSMGLLNMKLHIKVVDGNHFQVRKVSGGPTAILSSDGRNVDIDLGELRYGERKEMLVELELDNMDARTQELAALTAPRGNGHQRSLNATDQFVAQMGLDALSIGDSPDLADGMMDRMIDELPVFEVDGSFYDPAAAKSVSRLAHPVLLTVTMLPTSTNRARAPPLGSDPVIVRRRMEILTADMITRALVLVSRKNLAQAKTIMSETKRVLNVVLQTVSQALPPPGGHVGAVRNRKEILTLAAVRCIQAMLQDLQVLTEALEESVDVFAHDQRNFGAQQAMILRDQKSWTGRSAVERVFWNIDNSIELASRSADWVARD